MFPWLGSAVLQIQIAAAAGEEKACARHGEGGDGRRCMLGIVCGSGDSGCCHQGCCGGSSSMMGTVEEKVSLTMLPWLESAGVHIPIAAVVVVEKACARRGQGEYGRGCMLGVGCGLGDSGCCLQRCCRCSSSVLGTVAEEVSLTMFLWLRSAGLTGTVSSSVVGGEGMRTSWSRWGRPSVYARHCVWL